VAIWQNGEGIENLKKARNRGRTGYEIVMGRVEMVCKQGFYGCRGANGYGVQQQQSE